MLPTRRRCQRLTLVFAIATSALAPTGGRAQRPDSSVTSRNDSVTIRLVDVDVRAAVQALARYLDRPVLFGAVPPTRVTLETPTPVPRSQVLSLLRSILESQNLVLVEDSTAYQVQVKQPAAPPAQPGASPPPTQGGEAIQLFVIRLRHARAADVAATVNALYGRASALGEIGGPPPTLSDQLKQNLVPPAGAPPQAVQSVAARAATLSAEVTIVPDPRANSLLIRATRSDFDLIQAAVQELDTRPLQVLIEVMIAEVRKDRSLDFGVAASLPTTSIGSGNATIAAANEGAGLGDFVLRLMKIGAVDVDATLRAAAARGDASIISRPVVITANNEPAQILVGSQRPFLQVQRALPTDAAIRDQVVQYKEVGTKLFVVPTISADGYVMLEVTQEVNAATAETQFSAPVISTRSVQTRLLIKDGQTVALGGLTDRQKEVTQGGVPILSSIPLLGGFFGHASRRLTETELFLFLTPRVIRNDEEANGVTEPLRKRAERVKP
ncbi:MAG TPA: secretin N-terminal domain-containing protein [Gemmatimonadaceae bacterium]|jgi:general secretion pathway protein D|nr:secretin N-terminal domain-containing protein [Gemmatimonadaceae bacterium]